MSLPKESFKQLEEQFKGITQKFAVPGMAFSVVLGTDVVYSSAWGFRNKEKGLPCTPDTTFAIGSSSKSVAAFAIMQLVEKGLIKLEDPIDKFLPIKWARKYGQDNPITIHHLLSQTSGISDLGLARALLAKPVHGETQFEKYDLSTYDAYLKHANGAYEYINPPGRYSYCNSNFTLAHMIVEKVSGKSYDDYIQEHLFMPCDMQKSTLKNDVYKVFDDRMIGYLIQKKEGKFIPKPIDYFNFLTIMGCGGVYASANDLSKYLIMLLNDGTYKGKQLITKDSLQKLFTVHTPCQELIDFGIKGIGSQKGDGGYGYGWFVVNDFFGHKIILHPGSVAVASSILVMMPEMKIGMALTWNGMEELFSDFLMIIFGAFAMILGKDPMKEFSLINEDMRLNKLCGTYSDYIRGNPLEITRNGSDLFIEWVGGETTHRPKQPLHPIDKEGGCMQYYTKNSPTGYNLAEFIFEKDGKVRLLIEKHTMFKEEKQH